MTPNQLSIPTFYKCLKTFQEPKRFSVDLLQYLNGETQYLYSLLSLSENGAAPPTDRLVNAEMALEALANVIRHNRGKTECF
jgi:hypothetical protein